jgi:hypothetical protein
MKMSRCVRLSFFLYDLSVYSKERKKQSCRSTMPLYSSYGLDYIFSLLDDDDGQVVEISNNFISYSD